MSALSYSRLRGAALCALLAAALCPAGPQRNNFTSVAARHGYSAEEHTVPTEDGYLLTVFRVRRGRRCGARARRTPVYLMTGVLLSAEAWLAAGPRAGLAFLLPDACYDTWVGSVRGAALASRHRSLDPSADEAFWRFSADKIARYDVPAAVDYILAATGAEKLNYVGFSQGASVAFMMLSERPQYASKLGVLLAAAPPVALAHITSPFGRLLEISAQLEAALSALGVYEVSWIASAVRALAGRFCRFRLFRDGPCRAALEWFDAPHPGSVAAETIEALFEHFPDGTSVRTLARYGQAIGSGLFQKYDFGERENLKRYGSARPPAYELGAVRVPTVLLQGRGDTIVPAADSRWLAARLPDLRELYVVDDPAWNHFDVVFSRNINDTLYPKINQYLSQYSTP
ncbi:lipase member K-like [Maniola jurtina]|uniref:lipase member K-like n=1 Tax=Maniola jurtina TaxID=191418 RepID=UPI001E68EB15|nr:lipase member K-like [Maniola jurtina]